MSERDLSNTRFPWLKSGFDLEGYVGALAALLIGLLLANLWGPLFLIGLVGAGIALLGTRTAERTSPTINGVIVAPTDGLVVAIEPATPPAELRLPGDSWTRVRVAIGPTKSNGIYAAMDGEVANIIRETGDPAAFTAMKAERPGLAVLYFTLQGGGDHLGVRLATGGLGPRLEMDSESGDAVRLGRVIGTLRLGGWCDLYLPAGMKILPQAGQTLVGSETIIAQGAELTHSVSTSDQAAPIETALSAQTELASDAPAAEFEDTETPEADKADDEAAPEESEDPIEALIADEDQSEDTLTLEKIAGAVKSAAVEEDTGEADEDVSAMFERLRQEARKSDSEDN